LRKRGPKTVEVEEIPSELQPIANYEGSNSFVNDIKNKLKKFGSLSDKQRDIALQQIEKEGGWKQGEVQKPTKTFVDLVKQIQNEFDTILKQKIKNSKGTEMNETIIRITKSQIRSRR
jgi:poly(A) polymerase Pap1